MDEYSEAGCWLSIYFDGPKSLERPPSEKPKELAEAIEKAAAEDNTTDVTATDEDTEYGVVE